MIRPLLSLAILVMTSPATSQDATECVSFEREVESKTDAKNGVTTFTLPLTPDMIITAVELLERKSFYWCEMTVDDITGEVSVRRHFGHNSTHWWVTEGCEGRFRITACRGPQVIPQDTANPFTDPTSITVIENTPGVKGTESEKPKEMGSLDTHALADLFSWLHEQHTPIHTKLGGKLDRVPRSVDEEFAAEFEVNY